MFGNKAVRQSCENNPQINVVQLSTIKDAINKDKELAGKDIKSFCRDKAVELLHGYIVEGDNLILIQSAYAISVLEFLALLDRG